MERYDITSKALGIPKETLKKMDIGDIENMLRLEKEEISKQFITDPFIRRYPAITLEDYEKYGIN